MYTYTLIHGNFHQLASITEWQRYLNTAHIKVSSKRPQECVRQIQKHTVAELQERFFGKTKPCHKQRLLNRKASNMYFFLYRPHRLGLYLTVNRWQLKKKNMICGESFGECLALPGAHSSPPTFGRYGGFWGGHRGDGIDSNPGNSTGMKDVGDEISQDDTRWSCCQCVAHRRRAPRKHEANGVVWRLEQKGHLWFSWFSWSPVLVFM